MAAELESVPMSTLADVNPSGRIPGLSPDSAVSFIPMQDVSEGGEWTGDQIRRFREVETGYTFFVAGDVLFAKITPCMENGKGAHARCLVGGIGFGSTEFHVLRARGDACDRFVYHWCQSPALRLKAQAFMIGSAGQQRVQPDFFDNFRVPLLPALEQHRIAVILDTLDDAIRRTEQVIAKLQQMKQGLLQDLLTRGIDENGELRPPTDEAPHLYKNSPLGRIPKPWWTGRVSDALSALQDFRGRTPKKLGMEWGGGDVPALSAKNVRVGRIDLQQETYYGSSRLYEKWMTKGDAKKGDVLLTTEAPLGNVAQIPDHRRYILSQRVVLLRFDGTLAHNDFMAFQMAGKRFQSNLRKWSTGTTATGIQMAKALMIPVAAPPIPEQVVQVDIMRAALVQIEAETEALLKYRLAKQGLLHDLLTGRVRVSTPPEAAA